MTIAYAPILLGQKASRIRKEMDIEKGGRDVRTVYDTADRQ